jgi:glycosyltransferase involved in cell wall biosynthesis
MIDTAQEAATLPRISIVTLSFNQGRFLDAALRSVRDQGYPNVEHIVVDPGSTDDSRAIIDHHRAHLGPVILEPDDGPADGLNKGFTAATGAIFGCINADDLMLPGALQTIARHFTQRPDIGAICGGGVLIDADDTVLRGIRTSRVDLGDFGHGAMTFVQQGHYYRREAFAAAGGFNAANRTCWDAELMVDMVRAGVGFLTVPERLGAFRLYGDTITGSGRMAAQIRSDLARVQAKALGRAPRPSDRLEAPLRLFARRIADPAATLEGLRARLAR